MSPVQPSPASCRSALSEWQSGALGRQRAVRQQGHSCDGPPSPCFWHSALMTRPQNPPGRPPCDTLPWPAGQGHSAWLILGEVTVCPGACVLGVFPVGAADICLLLSPGRAPSLQPWPPALLPAPAASPHPTAWFELEGHSVQGMRQPASQKDL